MRYLFDQKYPGNHVPVPEEEYGEMMFLRRTKVIYCAPKQALAHIPLKLRFEKIEKKRLIAAAAIMPADQPSFTCEIKFEDNISQLQVMLLNFAMVPTVNAQLKDLHNSKKYKPMAIALCLVCRCKSKH